MNHPFINPIELLGLHTGALEDINSQSIKKAKRLLFADIDLSDDGSFVYHAQQLNRSDCERVLTYVDGDSTAIKHYFLLAQKPLLNNFLINGNTELFKSGAQTRYDGITRELIQAFSDEFTHQVNATIHELYMDSPSNALIPEILGWTSMLPLSLHEKAVRSLMKELQERLMDYKREVASIETKPRNTVMHLYYQGVQQFPVKLCNALPDVGDMLCNQLADTFNSIAVQFNNTLKDYPLAVEAINYTIEFRHDESRHSLYASNQNIFITNKGIGNVRSASPTKQPISTWAIVSIGVIIIKLIHSLVGGSSRNYSNSLSLYDNQALTKSLENYRLDNGKKPYSYYFGTEKQSILNTTELTLTNNRAHDAIVCLINKDDSSLVRHAYIRTDSSVVFSAIPKGSYFLRYYSGQGWSDYNAMYQDSEDTDGTSTNSEDVTKDTTPEKAHYRAPVILGGFLRHEVFEIDTLTPIIIKEIPDGIDKKAKTQISLLINEPEKKKRKLKNEARLVHSTPAEFLNFKQVKTSP